MGKIVSRCACGTRIKAGRSAEMHRKGVWHAVAMEARNMRKMGLSYREIARHLKMRGHAVSVQWIWMKLSEEGL